VRFSQPDRVETFSSRGPTLDGRTKPDVVAVDCTTTLTYRPFCGTSASAPYAAGAAALVVAARPGIEPAALATWLRAHAAPLGEAPNNTSGHGRLELGPVPAAPTPTALGFSVQPAAAVEGLAIARAITVRVLDQDGQPVTSGEAATAPVTLAVAGTGGASAGGGVPAITCPAGLTTPAVDGVATFSGCSLAPSAKGVVLQASTPGLASASSAPFDVHAPGSAPAPAAALTTSAQAIPWGTAVNLRAQLQTAGSPLAGSLADRAVTFEASADRTIWHSIGTATTTRAGRATLAHRSATNTYYRVSLAASPDLGAAASEPARVTVRQTTLLRPTAHGAVRSVPRNSSITFATTVRPAGPTIAAGPVVFEVYRQVGSTRRLVATRRVTPDAAGIATLTVRFSSTGAWFVRSMASPTRVNANSTWTAFERFQVR
jgi:hypothetical protein